MLYEVNIVLTNRNVPIPEVLPRERLLVEQLEASGFYHVIARSASSRTHANILKSVLVLLVSAGGPSACCVARVNNRQAVLQL
jgi:hypothetical protein